MLKRGKILCSGARIGKNLFSGSNYQIFQATNNSLNVKYDILNSGKLFNHVNF